MAWLDLANEFRHGVTKSALHPVARDSSPEFLARREAATGMRSGHFGHVEDRRGIGKSAPTVIDMAYVSVAPEAEAAL
jgi:hypothetical protein